MMAIPKSSVELINLACPMHQRPMITKVALSHALASMLVTNTNYRLFMTNTRLELMVTNNNNPFLPVTYSTSAW